MAKNEDKLAAGRGSAWTRSIPRVEAILDRLSAAQVAVGTLS